MGARSDRMPGGGPTLPDTRGTRLVLIGLAVATLAVGAFLGFEAVRYVAHAVLVHLFPAPTCPPFSAHTGCH